MRTVGIWAVAFAITILTFLHVGSMYNLGQTIEKYCKEDGTVWRFPPERKTRL